MAIEKEKVLNNGYTGNYWRITTISINTLTRTMVGSIGLFKDKATSDAGGQPILIKQFHFNFTMQEFLASSNVIALTYEKIIAQAETLLHYDINGSPIVPPIPRDADIADGTVV